MTFNPESTDPREVLDLTIESQHIKRGFTIGDYLLYVGVRAFNRFKDHGAGADTIPTHVYRDLGRTLAKNGVLKTNKLAGSATWDSADVRPVLQFLFDYLTNLDFTKLPEIERPREYTLKLVKGADAPDYLLSALYTRTEAEEMLQVRKQHYPENTYELVKVIPA